MRPRRSGSAILDVVALSACLFAGAALAADGGDVAKGKAIAAQGNASGLSACGTCHGVDGGGMAGAGIPRLAGLPAAYLERQLRSFGNGSRANSVMTPLAKMMDRVTMADLAAYYATIEPFASAAPSGVDAKTVALGEALALHGDWSRKLPACASCHGLKGLGVGAAFPPLAGQSGAYIAMELHDWRDGTRHDDPLGLMHTVSSRLDEAQIAAVAAYYQTLPPPGAPR